MRKIWITLVLQLLVVSFASAHSGGTNSCGGHNDRKRGGYHVHNFVKYCVCHPNVKGCKKDRTKEGVKKEQG